MTLHEFFASRVDALREERRALAAQYGDRVMSQVTVSQAVGGMRDVRALVCDTSVVDPNRGLIIRGHPVLEIVDRAPEEVFILLLTGEMPDAELVASLQEQMRRHADPPEDVWRTLASLPEDAHPMTMLSAALLAMDAQSAFRERLRGLPRAEYWRPALDDAIALFGVLPAVAAGIYRMRYDKGERIPPDPTADWAASYCRMLGIDDEVFFAAMRRAAILQCDHEGGNVAALTCHTVGSVLSNPYLALSAAFNGLAGPLHGLASQESIQWVHEMMRKADGAPTPAEIESFAWETLRAGRVIPGYGHAVLRGLDPRFTAMIEFGKEHFGTDAVFETVAAMADVVPRVLKEHGKAKNPYPNVDAGMGAVWHHFRIEELPYYTVPFAISLALGMLAQLVINRALMSPITRPRSVSSEWIRQTLE